MYRELFILLVAAAACMAQQASSSDGCVPCLVDPCENQTCPLDPNAVCKPDLCACTFKWISKYDGFEIDHCHTCPAGQRPYECLYGPCSYELYGQIGMGCMANPQYEAKCWNDVCDGCWPRYHYPNGSNVECWTCPKGRFTYSTCRGLSPHQIAMGGIDKISVCYNATCADPTAKCVVKYCNEDGSIGCNALWLRPDYSISDCKPPMCPGGELIVECPVEPCTQSRCPGDPTATCNNSHCGECKAVWTAADGTPAKCIGSCPDQTNPTPVCPNDPCAGLSCPDDLTATCTVDHCGCKAVWTRPDGLAPKCNCPNWAPATNTCPRSFDICDFMWCPFEPSSACHMSSCGFCHPEWTLSNGDRANCWYFF